MTNQLDTITIEGHPIVVAPHEGLVLVRPICEAIGISFGSQRNRLARQPWARVSIMNTHDASGRVQEMFALPKSQVPMWLATISVNKVKDPRAREVLILFQVKCAEVLDAYWSGRALEASNGMPEPHVVETATKWLRCLRRDASSVIISRKEHIEAARRTYLTLGVVGTLDLNHGQMSLFDEGPRGSRGLELVE